MEKERLRKGVRLLGADGTAKTETPADDRAEFGTARTAPFGDDTDFALRPHGYVKTA